MILAELNPNKNRVKTELEPCEDWYDVPSDEMTLEQAKQAVKDLREKLAEYLEQKPCDNNWRFYYNHGYAQAKRDLSCDDCISRQSIKRKLQERHDFFIHAYNGFSNMPQNDKSRVDEINNCIAMVANEPPVTPKKKIGHWVKTPKAVMGEGYMWYCDKCEHQVYQDSSRDYPSEKYCPNCGARMVSE